MSLTWYSYLRIAEMKSLCEKKATKAYPMKKSDCYMPPTSPKKSMIE
jgi:hypothetical protein